MTNYKTTFEATRNIPETVCIGHGENADLFISITDEGLPVALSGYSVRAIYQPKSKWQSEDFYECPSEIVGNEAIVHWGNTYDNGDDAVKMWVRFEKGGKVSYPALYQLNLFKTPGFDPSTITPIPEVIDFDVIPYRNAPWLLSDDFQGWVNTSFNPTVSTLSASSPEVIAYTGTNKQEVKDFILSHPNAVIFNTEGNHEWISEAYFYKTFENVDVFVYSSANLDETAFGWFEVSKGPQVIQSDFRLFEFPVPRRDELDLFALNSDLTTLSTTVGNINTILDSINGEVI